MKLETANKMTVQELCDYAIEKLVEQGERCISIRGTSCLYGNSKGQHCAIGWLLDAGNTELMNAAGDLNHLIIRYSEFLPKAILENKSLFLAFQNLHDSVNYRQATLETLQRVYNLNTSNPAYVTWVNLLNKTE